MHKPGAFVRAVSPETLRMELVWVVSSYKGQYFVVNSKGQEWWTYMVRAALAPPERKQDGTRRRPS